MQSDEKIRLEDKYKRFKLYSKFKSLFAVFGSLCGNFERRSKLNQGFR